MFTGFAVYFAVATVVLMYQSIMRMLTDLDCHWLFPIGMLVHFTCFVMSMTRCTEYFQFVF